MKTFVRWYPIILMQSVSTLFLVPVAFFLERKDQPKLNINIIGQQFISALLGASVSQYLFLLGIQNTSATFACAFLNIVPVFTFMMASLLRQEVVILREGSGKAKVLGALVCSGGVIVLTCYKGTPLIHFSKDMALQNVDFNSKKWILGSLALLAGTLCWSSWFLMQTRLGKIYPFPYSSTALMSFFSALQSGVLCLSMNREPSVWFLKRNSDIFIVLFTGVVASGLCFAGMSWCVKKRGPVFTVAFSPLVQIMAAAYEVPVLQEQLYLGRFNSYNTF